MRDYRLYWFDGASRITSAETIMAGTDAEALAEAKVMMDGCFSAELWHRDRLVKRISPSS
jgi:hypothetical protein